MSKIERQKKLSDEICTAILKGVRFSPHWGRLREGAESYAKALASDILR